ncbi:hypothetical protein [Parafrankia sp. BMG5.11]|uniref:hypothetical protein n=1 Tax=Parafrankia sp. BMG5.11 TaxID=222540 RepID=UPI00103870FF|nr:hypothetical protein [Parafrankia sp. BMG5.11]TCJ40939.1 hypothetical protein E0504_03315 [Parafrankia sp. BMG5.11]
MGTPVPPPDPANTPLSAHQLGEDDRDFADDGPVLDIGPSEIDIERRNAGVRPDPERAAPPEAELPPD